MTADEYARLCRQSDDAIAAALRAGLNAAVERMYIVRNAPGDGAERAGGDRRGAVTSSAPVERFAAAFPVGTSGAAPHPSPSSTWPEQGER